MTSPSKAGPATTAVRCLGHPATLSTLAVFFINQEILKPAIGRDAGWLTGKLSDFSGLFFFPFLLALAISLIIRDTNRVGRVAMFVSALLWTWAKTTETGNAAMTAAVVPFVGAIRIVRDPTDVLALVVLWPAWKLWRVQSNRPERVGTTSRLPVVIAALACAAHHSNPGPERIWGLASDGTQLYCGSDYWNFPDGINRNLETGATTINGIDWNFFDPHAKFTFSGFTVEHPEDERSRYSPRHGKVVTSPIDPMTRFRIGAPNRIEESSDGGRTWRFDWELTPDRADVIARQTCSLLTECRASISDLEFFPDKSGALAIAINLPVIAVRSAGGSWSLIGSPKQPNRVRFATFDWVAITPEIIIVAIMSLAVLLGLRDNMGLGTASSVSIPRLLILAIILFPAVSLLFITFFFFGIGLARSPNQNALLYAALKTVSVIFFMLHGSRSIRGLAADFAFLIGTALAAGLIVYHGELYALALVSAAGAVCASTSSRITRLRPKKFTEGIIVGTAALLLPIVGITPFFLWSGGIVPRYWLAAVLSAAGLAVVTVDARKALRRAVDASRSNEPG